MSSKRQETSKDKSKRKVTAVKPDAMAPEVLEFIQAIDDYKRLNNRPFPNWSEILDVVKSLGYEKDRAA